MQKMSNLLKHVSLETRVIFEGDYNLVISNYTMGDKGGELGLLTVCRMTPW